jgi:phosphoribosylaminoimidazole (AIR) synthetase
MPYVGGETPEIGDYVKNQWQQPGTVIGVHAAQDGLERINIRWDDGAFDLPLAFAEGFTLLSRKSY